MNQAAEDAIVFKRAGYSSRDDVRRALDALYLPRSFRTHTAPPPPPATPLISLHHALLSFARRRCYDEEKAIEFLEKLKEISRVVEDVHRRRGLATGVGYPTRLEIKQLLAERGNEEGVVVSLLRKQWRVEVEMMTETPPRVELAPSRPMRACRCLSTTARGSGD